MVGIAAIGYSVILATWAAGMLARRLRARGGS